jgi:hypothetical protein
MLTIFQLSLSTSFSPTSVPRQTTTQPSQSKGAESSAIDPPASSEIKLSESSTSTDDWKTEYHSQVNTWRAQSAEAREKAERERNRWEGIREAEKRDAEKRKAEGKSVHLEGHEGGWETVSQGQSSLTTSTGQILSPGPVDARDLVAGEIPREFGKVRNICNSFLLHSHLISFLRVDPLMPQSPQSDLRANTNDMILLRNGKIFPRSRPHFPLRRSQNAPQEHPLNSAPATVTPRRSHLPYQLKHLFLRLWRYSIHLFLLEPAYQHYSHHWL